MALGIFSLWDFWNHAAWPKYGLENPVRQAYVFWNWQTRTDEPLAGGLEGEPLKFEVLGLADRRDLVLGIVLVDQVMDDREGFPVLRCEWVLDEVLNLH